MKWKSEKIAIECDCGTHMLKVQSELDYYGENNERYRQEFYFAMFSYGNGKRSIWRRIKYAWKIILKDEVYSDQLVFSPEEMKRLQEFINNNLLTPLPSN